MRFFLTILLIGLITTPALASPPPTRLSGSYYHHKFEGRPMACGGRFDSSRLTAASNRFPCGSQVRVTHRGRSVAVTITDRCGRCGIDLSRAAAREIGLVPVGRARVAVERVD
jgi:rare lipoprotein A